MSPIVHVDVVGVEEVERWLSDLVERGVIPSEAVDLARDMMLHMKCWVAEWISIALERLNINRSVSAVLYVATWKAPADVLSRPVFKVCAYAHSGEVHHIASNFIPGRISLSFLTNTVQAVVMGELLKTVAEDIATEYDAIKKLVDAVRQLGGMPPLVYDWVELGLCTISHLAGARVLPRVEEPFVKLVTANVLKMCRESQMLDLCKDLASEVKQILDRVYVRKYSYAFSDLLRAFERLFSFNVYAAKNLFECACNVVRKETK